MSYIPVNFGASNLGNTSGTSGVVSHQLVFAGGNNITLSQSKSGGSATITISAGAGGAAGTNTLGMSNLGNTVGTSGVVTGSNVLFAFAGGNNVTLSQSLDGSSGTITISGPNTVAQSAQTQSNIQAFYDGANSISTGTIRVSNSNGISFGINGQTLTASHNGITSQTNQSVGLYGLGNTTQNSSTTLDARSLSFNGLGAATVGYSNGSIQLSVATQTVQTQNLHNVTLAGNSTSAGAGYAHVSSGTLTLAGGNNVTLSQNGNAVTISAGAGGAAGTNTLGMSNLGNTSGTSGVVTGSAVQFAFAGGNNVTLSQSVNASSATITVSAANQTVQTQSRFNLTLAGNSTSAGAGYAEVSSGTLTLAGGNNITLSQNGNAVTISGGGGGAAGTNTLGMSNLGNTSGTSGVVTGSNIQFAFAGGNNITLSQSINASSGTITISAANAGGGATGSYFDNMFQQNSVQALTFTSLSTGLFGRVVIQPLAPGNEQFPYNITASTMLFNFSANATATVASSSHSSSFYVGVYTRVNSTQLSLLNSVSSSWGMTADTRNSVSYHGARWLTIHSSQWSSQPVFSENIRYFFGILFRTSNYSGSNGSSLANSLGGMHLGHSVQRSGFVGSSATSNTSFNAWHPFMGVHSLTTHTNMPANIANSEINKASVYANFIPQVVMDAGLGEVD